MLSIESETLDHIFLALGSPVRRRILHYLAESGEATVTEIAAPFDVSLNAISKHMKVLEKAGLIQRDIRGREHYCRLHPQTLNDSAEWLNYYRQFWTTRLDAMEQRLLARTRSEEA
jgi:DNA-binding transcriptional ArsR family regulator